MIQMQLTDAGLAAITRNENITFTRFVTGSGTDGTDHVVAVQQDVPISYSQTYIKGQSYLINGVQTAVNYNAVELIGTLSTADANEAYNWTELALMAREGAGQEYTFAYGISANNAYRVNPNEAVTYVIPFSIIFSDTPNVTVNTTESGVSWSAFLEHTNRNVINGVHGLEVKNGRIYVNNSELDIATQTALTTNVNTLRAEMQLADGELSDSIDSVNTSLTSSIETVESTLTSSIQSVNTSLTSSINSVNSTLTQGIQDVQDNLDDEVSSLTGSIDSASSALDTRITNVNSALTASIESVNTSLSDDITSLNTSLTDSINSVESSLTESIGTVNTNLTDSINTKTAALLLDLNNRTKNILGVDIIVDTLPLNPIDYLGQIALLTSDDKWYRSEYREKIEAGDWIKAVDGVWRRVTSDTEDAMLVVADDAELGSMEIHVSDAQAYFTIWSPLRDINFRLEALESTTTNYLTYKPLDDTEYNDETIVRMTGSGTVLDPYLIYTPMDFEQIRAGGANQYKNYRIMNNLDFSKAIGIKVNETDGDIEYETVDDTAPLYNSGSGFVPFPTDQKFLTLDGGGHTIRNLLITSTDTEKCGIFRYCSDTTISNLIIKDSYLSCYRTNGTIMAGSLAGEFYENCTVSNVASYMKIYGKNSGTYDFSGGGLVARVRINCRFTNCAFHGSIQNNNLYYAYLGGIVGYDDSTDSNTYEKSKFVACYNSASLYGKRCIGIGNRVRYLNNCYNSGRMDTTDMSGDSSSLTSNMSATYLSMENCYSLEGSALTVQGTVLSDYQLKLPSAADRLNAGLLSPAYSYKEGSYPALDFEILSEANLKSSTPIAAVDPETKLVTESGFTIGRLLGLPSALSLGEMWEEIDSIKAGKSSVSKLSITLASDEWADDKQTISSLANVTANSVLVLIPKSSDCFDAGIYIDTQADGSITFGCTSVPSVNINVDVLVIN